MTPAILIVAFGRGETNRAYYFASRGPSRDGGFRSFINGFRGSSYVGTDSIHEVTRNLMVRSPRDVNGETRRY